LVAEAIDIVPRLPHVEITNAVTADVPLLDLDKDQMRQVFVNLIQNAAEAIPNDVAGRVNVTSKVIEDMARISVIDNGPGIPVDAHIKIFQPLFSTKVKGTGLGLAVTAGIIRRHGGQIRVRSDGTSGTTMEVDLPLNRRQTNS
jgi:signal transduction histidine kinase